MRGRRQKFSSAWLGTDAFTIHYPQSSPCVCQEKKKFVYFLTLTTSIGESSVAVLQLKLNTGGVYRKYACTVAPEDTDMSC